MIQRVLSGVLVVVLTISLFGCASAAPAPAPAPQDNPSPAAPAAESSPLPLPPQPTSPPPPTGIAVPYQTQVPAPIVGGSTLAPTNAPTLAATRAPATAATVQPTATKVAAAAVPTAPGVATGKKTEAKFTFTPALATIEDTDPLDAALVKVSGIFDVSSSQTSSTVNYDAGLITVEQIMQAFAQFGHPVKPE